MQFLARPETQALCHLSPGMMIPRNLLTRNDDPLHAGQAAKPKKREPEQFKMGFVDGDAEDPDVLRCGLAQQVAYEAHCQEGGEVQPRAYLDQQIDWQLEKARSTPAAFTDRHLPPRLAKTKCCSQPHQRRICSEVIARPTDKRPTTTRTMCT